MPSAKETPKPALVEGTYRTTSDEFGTLASGTIRSGDVCIDFTERTPNDVDPNLGSLVFVPGLHGLKWTYGPPRDTAATLLHRRGITYRHARREHRLASLLHPKNLLHPARIGAESALAMFQVAEELNPGGGHIAIGHSKGGPDAVDAILEDKDGLVERVVLFASGGLERDQNTLRMAARTPGEIFYDILPCAAQLARERDDRGRVIGEAAMHSLAHPTRFIGEILDISNRPFMDRELTLLAMKGVSVHVVHAGEDRFFPPHRSAIQAAGKLAASVDILPGAGHTLPQDDPKQTSVAIGDAIGPRAYVVDLARAI